MQRTSTEILHERRYFFAFIWALVIAADLIAVSYYMAGQRNAERYTAQSSNERIIEQFEKIQEQRDIGIIMLGNSRLRHAVTFGFRPETMVRMPDGRTAAALQFSLNAAWFNLYQGFADQILDANPDVILIQDGVISNAHNTDRKVATMSRLIFDYFYKIATDYDVEEEWWADRLDIDNECDFAYNEENVRRRLKFMEKDMHSLEEINTSYANARKFIQKAVEQGTKVIILRLSPYLEYFSYFDVPVHKVDFHGLGFYPTEEQLLPVLHDKVIWLSYADEEGIAHFCDDVHFNEKGRQAFSKWLLQKIDTVTR